MDKAELLTSDCFILRNIGKCLKMFFRKYYILNEKFDVFFEYLFKSMLERRGYFEKETDYMLCCKIINVLDNLIGIFDVF